MVTVEIDPQSGFCGGVIRAISRAERFLAEQDHLYSLGAIVHNEAELDRLGGGRDASRCVRSRRPRRRNRPDPCPWGAAIDL